MRETRQEIRMRYTAGGYRGGSERLMGEFIAAERNLRALPGA